MNEYYQINWNALIRPPLERMNFFGFGLTIYIGLFGSIFFYSSSNINAPQSCEQLSANIVFNITNYELSK